ncbi:hypothetical protein [Caldiplasma sukawensis]
MNISTDQIRERIERHNLFAVKILEEIRKKIYDCEYKILKDYCYELRKV